jgi:ribosomal protein L22
MGPRKVRLVADLIRGHKVTRAIDMLSLLNKLAAKPVLKLLNSAVANAKHNYSMNVEGLRIATITVDGGPLHTILFDLNRAARCRLPGVIEDVVFDRTKIGVIDPNHR